MVVASRYPSISIEDNPSETSPAAAAASSRAIVSITGASIASACTRASFLEQWENRPRLEVECAGMLTATVGLQPPHETQRGAKVECMLGESGEKRPRIPGACPQLGKGGGHGDIARNHSRIEHDLRFEQMPGTRVE